MADFDKVILNGTTYTIPQGDGSFKLYNYSSGSCFNFDLDNKKLMMGQTTPQKRNHAIWLLIRNESTNTYEAACFWVQYGINQRRKNEWSSIFSNLSNYGGTVTGELDFTGFDTSNLSSCLEIYTCSQEPTTQGGYTITNGTIDDTVFQLINDNPSYSGASREIKTMVTNSEATVNQSAAIQRLYDEKALSELDSEQSSSLTDGYITKTVRHYRYSSDGNPTYQDKTERFLKIDTDSFDYDSNTGLTFTQPYIDGTLVSQNLTPVFTITDLESTYSYEGQNEFNAIVIDIVPAFADEFGNGNINIDYPSGSGYTYGYANINYDSYSGLSISGQLTQDNYTTIDGVFGTKNLLLFPSSVHGPATITVRNDSGLIAGVSFYMIYDNEKLSFTKWQTNVMTHIYGSDTKEEVTSRALNYVNNRIGNKQDTLVSGTNIKTINNESILGEGNITIEGGGTSYTAGDGIDITNDVITNTREQRVLTFDDSTTGVKAALKVVSPHWDYSNNTVSDPANGLTFVNNVPASNADPYVQSNYLDGTLMEFEITDYSVDSSSNFSFDLSGVSGGVMFVYDESDDEWEDEVAHGAIYAKDSFDVGMKIRMNSTMLSALLTAMQADCPYETMEVQYKTYAWNTNKSVSGVHSGTAYQLAYNSDLTALAARVTALETALGTISSSLDNLNGEVI